MKLEFREEKERTALRRIEVHGHKYNYTIGKHRIRITNEENKSVSPDFSEVTGREWSDIERDSYNKSFAITPKDISEWIKNNLK
jgi:NADP-dependent 3-hydroxy acid dehydrogenase YdfG